MSSDDPKARHFQRTMHTPDDAVRAELRAALRDLSQALLPLHRALIADQRAIYASENGEVTPNRLIQLLYDDPFFAWLKPVTALIVDIDEMTRTDFEPADAFAIADRTAHLFGTSADPEFWEKYVPVLQRDFDVAVSHAAVRKLIARILERREG